MVEHSTLSSDSSSSSHTPIHEAASGNDARSLIPSLIHTSSSPRETPDEEVTLLTSESSAPIYDTFEVPQDDTSENNAPVQSSHFGKQKLKLIVGGFFLIMLVIGTTIREFSPTFPPTSPITLDQLVGIIKTVSPPTSPPSTSPTFLPTRLPTLPPTRYPTASPTASPTDSPTQSPTSLPTKSPTPFPTQSPTSPPTQSPTPLPTQSPTSQPTQMPTFPPTPLPTFQPSSHPTQAPTSPSTSACIAWRQTSFCRPNGLRQPHNDKDCDTLISPGLSGYCQCIDFTVGYGCYHDSFNCLDVCNGK